MSLDASSTELECKISPWAKWGFYEPDDYVLRQTSSRYDNITKKKASNTTTSASGLAFRPKKGLALAATEPRPITMAPSLVIRNKQQTHSALNAVQSPSNIATSNYSPSSSPPVTASGTVRSSNTPRFRPQIRLMLDEVCVTPTLQLEEEQWDMLDFVYLIPVFYAPQAYQTMQAGLLDTYFLVQVTSTKGIYADLQLLRFSADEASEFDSHIKRNVTKPGMVLKIEMHFGKTDDSSFLKEVWADQTLDCWPGEESFVHSDGLHVWVPKEGEEQPDLKKMTKVELRELRNKQEVQQPSTFEWFSQRAATKLKSRQ